jgi:arsenite-transporting ATPase
MSALFYVEEFHKGKQYDTVIMDTAPTADTLRLLAFPETANWYFDRLFHMVRNVIKVARLTVGKIISTPLPSDRFLEDLENLRERLGYVRDLLTDPEITSIRLVVNPERMVISETQRAYTYLCLYGYTVESIVINRIVPDELGGDYFDAKLEEQRKYLKVIDEAFSPLKTISARMMPREVLGIKALEGLGDELFGKDDPTKIYSMESPMKMYDEDDKSVLAIKLPFPMDQKLELYTRKDDLTVQLGAFKKSITLPHSMANKEVLGADMEDGWLKVKFQGEDHGKRKDRKKRRGRKEAGKAR